MRLKDSLLMIWFFTICRLVYSYEEEDLRMIDYWMRSGQLWDAYSKLNEIITNEFPPINNRLYILRAECALKMSMVNECIENCRIILENSPTDFYLNSAHETMARAYITNGDYENALGESNELPNNYQLRDACYELLKLTSELETNLEDGNYYAAAQTLDTLIQNSPNSKEFLSKRANVAFQLQDFRRFRHLFDQISNEFPDDGQLLYQLGITYFCDKDFGHALDNIKRSQKMMNSPRNIDSVLQSIESVRDHLINAERFLQQQQFAESEFEIQFARSNATSFCPVFAPLMSNIRIIELEITRHKTPEEQVDILTSMINEEPHNIDLMLERADLNLHHFKNYDAALFDYKNAHMHMPCDQRAFIGMNKAKSLQKQLHYVDHYKILGLSKSASAADIQAAFKNLVREWHPDRFTNQQDKESAELKMKKINHAYEILRSPYKKRMYDLGHDPDDDDMNQDNDVEFSDL